MQCIKIFIVLVQNVTFILAFRISTSAWIDLIQKSSSLYVYNISVSLYWSTCRNDRLSEYAVNTLETLFQLQSLTKLMP